MAAQVQVINYALELIASQTQITAINDGSPAAVAAQTVYGPTVNLLLRELDPDFARAIKTLNLTNNPPPFQPWQFIYDYPADCLRVRQVVPQAGTYDINNPFPVRMNVGFIALPANVVARAIMCNQPNVQIVYTTSSVTESLWDSVFAEAVARRLGNPLAMALSGRPDVAKQLLEEATQIAMTGGAVDESAMRPF